MRLTAAKFCPSLVIASRFYEKKDIQILRLELISFDLNKAKFL